MRQSHFRGVLDFAQTATEGRKGGRDSADMVVLHTTTTAAAAAAAAGNDDKNLFFPVKMPKRAGQPAAVAVLVRDSMVKRSGRGVEMECKKGKKGKWL